MRAGEPGDAALFPKTSWSLIGRAADGSSVLSQQALGELVTRYQPALRIYLTAGRGMSTDAADDLLQEFIVTKILAEGLVARAEAEKGKFRTFLMASLRNFLIDSVRAAKAKKRSSGKTAASVEDCGATDPRMKDPPEVFDEAWAREVVHHAVELMRRECKAENKPDVWTVFEARLLIPSRDGSQPPAYDALVPKLGVKSTDQVSNLLAMARRMFSRNVRAAIAEYVGEEHLDQEIFDLRDALRRASPR